MAKQVTLFDFLTEAQVDEVVRLKDAKAICAKVILPNITEINRKIGQQNDPMYLAYACEYAVSQIVKVVKK